MVHEKHKGLNLEKHKITAVHFLKVVRCIVSESNCQVSSYLLSCKWNQHQIRSVNKTSSIKKIPKTLNLML